MIKFTLRMDFFLYTSEHTPNSFHVDNALNESLNTSELLMCFRDLSRVASSKGTHYTCSRNGIRINRG